jgi:hypothetical protein
MKCAALCALLLCVAIELGAAPAKEKPQQPPFSITTRLDRTALWVGDSVEYTIQVIHPRTVQFVLENLKKENLSLPPFVLRSIRVEEREWRDNQKLLQVVLLLTTYESGKSELIIPPVALYYFTRDGTLVDKEARAQVVRLQPQRIALRSTLSGGPVRLREFKEIHPVQLAPAIATLLLGLIGIVLVGSRAVAHLWHAAHRDKAVKRPVSRRVRQRWVHDGLLRIRKLAHDSAQEPKIFYAETGRFLRQYLTDWLDIEARGLTPEEAEEALQAAGYNGAFAQQIRTVLEQCEQAQYGKTDGRPAEDGRHQETLLGSLEQAIKTTPRAR